jgi:copper chaperone CopZ
VTTLKAARADLAAAVTTAVAALSGVTVLAYDPPTISGNAVTVSTAGVTDTEWRLFVRVYVDAVQSEAGQDLLDDVVGAVEDGLPSSVGRSDWDFAFDESKGCFVMLTTVDYPREDL